MAELQIQIQKKREEDRRKLDAECDWFSSKTNFVDGMVSTLVFHQEKDVMRQATAALAALFLVCCLAYVACATIVLVAIPI